MPGGDRAAVLERIKKKDFRSVQGNLADLESF